MSQVNLLRGCAAVGLVLSAIIGLDEALSPLRSAICADFSGCDLVRASPLAQLSPISLPIAGVVGFAALLGSTLSGSKFAGYVQTPLALLIAVLGALMLGYQLLALRTACPPCCLVDGISLVIGSVVSGGRDVRDPCGATTSQQFGWALVCLIGVLCGSAYVGSRAVAKVPDVVAKIVRKGGKVTVIEVTDFGCLHCKSLHETLDSIRSSSQSDIDWQIVARPSQMKGSRAAARLWTYLVKSGRDSRDLARRLFQSIGLSPEAAVQCGIDSGLLPADASKVVTDSSQDDVIRSFAEEYQPPNARVVPLTWVGGVLIIGNQPRERFESAVRDGLVRVTRQ